MKIQKTAFGRHARRRIHTALACIASLACWSTALADAPPAAPREIDATTVAAWADETFEAALARREFSGATVSVVRGGEILLAKGYGRADYAREDGVDPARTQFRIGSITKTFTATLIAQLLDEGRIRGLDDSANLYLRDYALPDNDGAPITLRHLLTHAAGFEDRFYFIGADRPTPARLSPEAFDALRPAYVRPAGVRVVYSNFGIAVLGRIVEDLVGAPIDQVMRERLFAPLGMTHTQLLVDIAEPAALGKPATIPAEGEPQATKFTAINPAIAPAGSIVSTAQDMAHYMIAQLGSRPTPVLSDAARANLHTLTISNAPESTQLGMVFFGDPWAGVPTVAHGGNWTGFHSWMVLLPTLDTGVFVSIMSEAPRPKLTDGLRTLVMRNHTPTPSPAVLSGAVYTNAFLAHFLGERRPLPAAVPQISGDIEGVYRPDRRVFASAESVGDLLALGVNVFNVARRNERSLNIGGAGPWRAAGDGVFVLDAPMRNRVIIRADAEDAAPVLIPDLGIYTATRIGVMEDPRIHAVIALAALLGLIAGAALLAPGLRRERSASVLIALATAFIGLSLAPLAYVGFADGASMMDALYAGRSGRLQIFVALANLMLIGAVLTLVAAVRSQRDRIGRTAFVVVGGAGAVLSAVLAAYNVIGWRVPGA